VNVDLDYFSRDLPPTHKEGCRLVFDRFVTFSIYRKWRDLYLSVPPGSDFARFWLSRYVEEAVNFEWNEVYDSGVASGKGSRDSMREADARKRDLMKDLKEMFP
jgi:hypothetical protein